MPLLLFKPKENKKLFFQEQTIVIWNPGGNNTSKISWFIAKEIAKSTTVALAELPCLGIPRLANEADIMHRTNHADTAILEYERKGCPPMDFWHKIQDNLAVLPANPYALPDHPVVHKVFSPETLQTFPRFFTNEARKSGYRVIIFDCQGLLVSPMTFFALQQAQKIILAVDSPADIAWALINKERLTDTYRVNENAFFGTTMNYTQYHEEMSRVLKSPFISKEKLISQVILK